MKKLTISLLILFGLFWVLPAYFTLQTSFLASFTSPLNLTRASLGTWAEIPWLRLSPWAANSLIICLANAVLSPLVCISAGYGFARFNFPGRDKLFYLFLVAMAVPGTMLFLPRYLIVADMKLTDTLIGLFAPVIMSPAMVFLSRQYLSGIDTEILDAARLDGASELRVFRSVVLPLCVPLIVLASLGAFSVAWSDFMWQYLVARDYQTLTVGLGLFILSVDAGGFALGIQGSTVGLSMESMKAAVSMIQSLPLIIIFGVGQKWFVEGVRL